jgi:hypothetical protein
MTLFWHKTGPLLKYEGGSLHVEDLNPQIKTRWRMSRLEMFLLGCKCLWSSIRE